MWTALQLAERYGLRVQSRGADPVLSGSSGWLSLEAEPASFETIPVIKLLSRRGVPIPLSKRAIEDLFDYGHARVHAEHIDEALEGELRACKVHMSVLPAEAATE